MIEVGIVPIKREEWIKTCEPRAELTKEEKELCKKALDFGKKLTVVRVTKRA